MDSYAKGENCVLFNYHFTQDASERYKAIELLIPPATIRQSFWIYTREQHFQVLVRVWVEKKYLYQIISNFFYYWLSIQTPWGTYHVNSADKIYFYYSSFSVGLMWYVFTNYQCLNREIPLRKCSIKEMFH